MVFNGSVLYTVWGIMVSLVLLKRGLHKVFLNSFSNFILYSEPLNNELNLFRGIIRYSISSLFDLNFHIRNNEKPFNPLQAPKIINLKIHFR